MSSPETNSWMDDAFDFDEWADIYKRDPEAFERRRAEWIHQYIESAPPHLQPRLRGVMFRVDAERRLARNPIDACVRLTAMMWDSFTDMQRELGCARQSPTAGASRPLARVLPFRRGAPPPER